MSDRSVVVYLYDGSYEGLLSCVFESFARKENPIEISVQDTIQTSFYPTRNIDTDLSKAERVKKGICTKMSKEAYELVQLGYFTCHPQKEKLILELKDKLRLEDALEHLAEPMTEAGGGTQNFGDVQADAVQALVALGYGSTESLRAVKQVELDNATVEDVLKEALKKML